MDEIWSDEDTFVINDMKFCLIRQNFNDHRTTKDSIALIKSRGMIDRYKSLIRENAVTNILEFGIFEGGSALLLAAIEERIKFVGIDIRPPSPAVLGLIRDHGLTDRIKLYYGTSQSDTARVQTIIRTEFPEKRIDMIIDDASHQYELSRASFEASFHFLKSEGLYLIEDWAWAHWEEPYQTQQWADMPALTNLIFELVMLCGSRPDIISEMSVQNAIAIFRKGKQEVGNFSLSRLYRHRNRWTPAL
jgi:cephalosporin hydroxylase